MAAIFPLAALASPVDIPNEFAAGEAIVAEEFNENFDAIQEAVDDNDGRIAALEAGDATPAGAVMFFNLAACPAGWTEMAQMQGRVPVGLPSGGTLAAVIGTGLADEGTRSITQTAAHSHTVDPPATASATSGSHNHSVDPPATSSSTIAAHSHAASTSSAGSHVHSMQLDFDHNYGTAAVGGRLDLAGSGNTSTNPMNSAGSHTHSVSVGNAGGHSHTVNIPAFTSGAAASHTHSVDIGAFNSGSAGAGSVDVTMPYIQLLACQKD
ncbi:MAG: hypothetical protein AAF721_25020 [Myxococcota bacterium]